MPVVHIVMAHIVMAYIVIAYIVMAYIVMAYTLRFISVAEVADWTECVRPLEPIFLPLPAQHAARQSVSLRLYFGDFRGMPTANAEG